MGKNGLKLDRNYKQFYSLLSVLDTAEKVYV